MPGSIACESRSCRRPSLCEGDRIYLTYIRESIDLVERYTEGGKEIFTFDPRTRDAVLRRIETLTDAAAHLLDELKARRPMIPWRQVSDFRNVLAHGYTETRLDQLWHAIVQDLPALTTVVDMELART